jgi:hypothetical protein
MDEISLSEPSYEVVDMVPPPAGENTTPPIHFDLVVLRSLQTTYGNRAKNTPEFNNQPKASFKELKVEWKEIVNHTIGFFHDCVVRCARCGKIHQVSGPVQIRAYSLILDMWNTDVTAVGEEHVKEFLRKFVAIERDWKEEVRIKQEMGAGCV